MRRRLGRWSGHLLVWAYACCCHVFGEEAVLADYTVPEREREPVAA